MLTEIEFAQLNKEFPEGIPAWMVERCDTIEEVRAMMNLRRKAFPVFTATKH